jgi:hypothetical protein
MRIAAMLLAFASACVPGSIEGGGTPSPSGSPGPGGGDQPDASTVTTTDGSTGGSADASNCKQPVTANLTSGHHNAGQDCMNGCHNHGFTLAGTLFASSAGGTPVVGGTVTVTDSAGKTFDMVSQQNGNFYTSNAITFPITIVGSRCPDTQMMASQVTAGNGGCNKTGCHTAGAQGYIHLP